MSDGPMSDGRAAILGKLRRRLNRGERDSEAEARVAGRLADRASGPIPARARLGHRDQVDLFVKWAEAQAAVVTRLERPDQIPRAVADFLKAENQPAKLKLAPHPDLESLPWQHQPLLELESGRADGQETASLTRAVAGIAETGTLLLVSGPEGPSSLNFLPETHMVLLRASEIVGDYEAAWARLRARFPDGALPRTVNLVSGPSRTGDVEQIIQLGAHGPRRLHILLLDDDREEA
jgi:L-lactate dehydrogenase complex protein LldG